MESTLDRHIPLGPVTSVNSTLESPDVDILEDSLDRSRPGGILELAAFRCSATGDNKLATSVPLPDVGKAMNEWSFPCGCVS